MGLALSFDWENGEGIRGHEYARTYASLSIRSSDGRFPTRVLDKQSQSIRNEVRLPLFPIARWLIENWWFLLYEPTSSLKRSTRAKDAQFRSRHSLKSAGDGYALPDLLFEPTGDWVQVSWRAYEHDFAQLEFQDTGKIAVRRDDTEKELRRFVDSVLARMDEQGCSDPDLLHDWANVHAVDAEELDFCAAAASIGMDPFSLSRRAQHSLMLEWGRARETGISDQTFREICSVTAPGELGTTVSWLRQELTSLRPSKLTNFILSAKPKLHRKSLGNGVKVNPWSQGYLWAQMIRRELLRSSENTDIGNFLIEEMDEFSDDFGKHAFKAIIGPTKKDQVGLGILEGRDDSKRFRASRALFLALASKSKENRVSVATSSETDVQQASRAFGAELLAPAAQIRRLLGNRWIVGPDDVDELASVFHVSPILIQHQITNHQLAELDTSSPTPFGFR